MATINIFNIWSFFPHFFMKWECWCKVLCLTNCNHKKMFLFFWWKDLNIPFKLFDFQCEFSRPFQGTSNKIILQYIFHVRWKERTHSIFKRVFWLKIIVACIFTFQLGCQVKICCLTSDTIKELFREKYKHGRIKGWGYRTFKSTDELSIRKFQRD